MIDDKLQKLASIDNINAALKAFCGPSYVEPQKQVVKSDNYRQISRLQFDQGVIALVHACNLSGGSIDDVDLYKLIRSYMWYPEARAEINDVVHRHGS